MFAFNPDIEGGGRARRLPLFHRLIFTPVVNRTSALIILTEFVLLLLLLLGRGFVVKALLLSKELLEGRGGRLEVFLEHLDVRSERGDLLAMRFVRKLMLILLREELVDFLLGGVKVVERRLPVLMLNNLLQDMLLLLELLALGLGVAECVLEPGHALEAFGGSSLERVGHVRVHFFVIQASRAAELVLCDGGVGGRERSLELTQFGGDFRVILLRCM
jgi:hypothetical protein